MPIDRFASDLASQVDALQAAGTAKGDESVIVDVLRPEGPYGPRYKLAGEGDTPFIRMNSNSYLGLALREDMFEAEESAARQFGVGPGAVRFISGTYAPHVALEEALAQLHGRDACMIASAAYVTVAGVLVSLTTPETIIISDELNHNCIINGMRLSRPKAKMVYRHNDLDELKARLDEAVSVGAETVIVVTDGVFSMRGDYAPLKEIADLCREYDARFPKNVILMVDDSHGIGAYGETGRGTEEVAGARADILVGTLGKAFGVNGGYVVTDRAVRDYLREKNPFYIYSNPITPSEAAAALKAVELLESDTGRGLLAHIAAMTRRFEQGLVAQGLETIPSPHPVVPLMVRDTDKTRRLVAHLRANGILATGLNYPVVPKGDQLIRFQVCADHTEADIDRVLEVIAAFQG